jgi:ABC-type multidrug transport system fused ATPase/permease subunit
MGLRNFFIRLFTRRERDVYDEEREVYSRFKLFFENMRTNDPSYIHVRRACGLCEDALRIAKHRLRLSGRIQILDDKLAEVESFTRLTDDELEDLKRMLDRFVSLTSERMILLNKLSDFDNSLVEMFTLEDDAAIAMPQIKNAEKHQRALKHDLGYLQGEKEELVEEREDMIRTVLFINRFSIGIVALFLIVSLVLVYFYVFLKVNIFLPTAILVLLVMLIISLLYVFRQRVRAEMKQNLRKQHRAIELINKKSVVYAYYTNYLKYSYGKYKVKHSRVLEKNMKDFESYKFIVNRIDTVRSLMYETEDSIERFMKEKKLTGVKASIEGFARTVNLEDKKRYFTELKREKHTVEKELAELDARHEEIWDTLMALNEADVTKEHTIEKVISTYLTEAAKLFERVEQEKQEQEEQDTKEIEELAEEDLTEEKIFKLYEDDEDENYEEGNEYDED